MEYSYDPSSNCMNSSFRLTSETKEDEKFLEWFSRACQRCSQKDRGYMNLTKLNVSPLEQDREDKKKYLDLKIDGLYFKIGGSFEIPIEIKESIGISKSKIHLSSGKD